jgi:hypothetical protein
MRPRCKKNDGLWGFENPAARSSVARIVKEAIKDSQINLLIQIFIQIMDVMRFLPFQPGRRHTLRVGHKTLSLSIRKLDFTRIKHVGNHLAED